MKYRAAYHHLQRYWTNKSITRNDWQRLINHLDETISAGTINNNCTYYKASVRKAVKDGLFTIDFTYGTKIVGNNKNTRKDKTQILTISEINEVKKRE